MNAAWGEKYPFKIQDARFDPQLSQTPTTPPNSSTEASKLSPPEESIQTLLSPVPSPVQPPPQTSTEGTIPKPQNSLTVQSLLQPLQ